MVKFSLLIALATVLVVSPVLALSFGISPSSIEIDVSPTGYGEAEFTIHDFEGEVIISLEDIPLIIEPTSIEVGDDNKVIVRIYGDGTRVAKDFAGYICFLAVMGGNVGAGIKIKAVVHQSASDYSGGGYYGGGYPYVDDWGGSTTENGDDTSVVNGDDIVDNGEDSISPDEPADSTPSKSEDIVPVYPKKIDWDLVLLFGVIGLALASVLGYRAWRKRKKRLVAKE